MPFDLSTSDWLGVVSIVIALVGFGVTLVQVKRVRAALSSHVARSASDQLLMSVVRMERVEVDLRSSRTLASVPLVERAVLDWRSEAATAGALIPHMQGPPGQKLAKTLELSLSMAAEVLESLAPGHQDLAALLRPLLTQVGSATVAGRELAVNIVHDDGRKQVIPNG